MKKSRHKNKKVFNFSFSYKHNGGNGAEEYEDLEWKGDFEEDDIQEIGGGKKRRPRDELKKKNLTNKFLSKTPFFLSNLCRVYHSIRARQSDQKKLQNLETERAKRSNNERRHFCGRRRETREEASFEMF